MFHVGTGPTYFIVMLHEKTNAEETRLAFESRTRDD